MNRYKNAQRICLVVLLVTLLPAVASAAEPSRYEGTYRISDLASAEAARDASVEELAVKIPFLFRALARMRMKAAATVTLFFRFQPSPGLMTISSDRSTGWTTDLAASEMEFPAPQGGVFYLSRWMEESSLCSRGRRGNGTRESRFELSSDGAGMVVTTTIHNPHLPGPLIYITEYKREAGGSTRP